MHRLAQLDHRHVWHPFTQMADWLKREPIVIVEGQGAVLRDARGREFLDANSSIWTNLHGHHHPAINRALVKQLGRIAHSSALGLANEPASLLAAALVKAVAGSNSPSAKPTLGKVFFSDDGSTAMEVALKMAHQFARRHGRTKPKFISLQNAYHGDTIGAVSLGHIDLFHQAYAGLVFKSDRAPAPYCYRCPYNRAQPERADAREYRSCRWECLDRLEHQFQRQRRRGNPYAAFVFEPLIQGAAGMIPQPMGWLLKASKIARDHGSLLIADEVMTGFGRTGAAGKTRDAGLFACNQEQVVPDFMALAKGLTGGYLPLAATLTTQKVFDAFLGKYEQFKTFFHGHSFTANQLGASAALASLKLLNSAASRQARSRLERTLGQELARLWDCSHVGDIRQVGLIAGIELVRDVRDRTPYELRERAGIRVCEAMARRGVLTRAIGNVVVLMPPYCTRATQVSQMVGALKEAVIEVLGV
jgi:adenosylmethionine-8-amino-7-oxononanoate transaminase